MDTSKYHDNTALGFFIMIPVIQLLIWAASFALGGEVWDDTTADPSAEVAPAEEPAAAE